jgi:hypothetical protein
MTLHTKFVQRNPHSPAPILDGYREYMKITLDVLEVPQEPEFERETFSEPSTVRTSFGQSVRTWAKEEAPPQPIIAKIFRDIGQPDTGLTEDVEYLMVKLWKRDIPIPLRHPRDIPREVDNRHRTIRPSMLQRIMAHLEEHADTQCGIMEKFGIGNKTVNRALRELKEHGELIRHKPTRCDVMTYAFKRAE